MTINLFVHGHLADATFLKYLLSDGSVAPLKPLLRTASVVGLETVLNNGYPTLIPSGYGDSRDWQAGFVVDLHKEQLEHLLENEAWLLNLKLVDCKIEIPQGQTLTTSIIHKVAGHVLVWAGDPEEISNRGYFSRRVWEKVLKPARMRGEGIDNGN
jgi:hypothetical protein